jgi:Rrf2 family protein
MPAEKIVTVHQLAEMQDISPTYLSKILTKLVKFGLIESNSGAHGGYKLSKRKNDISFLDVIYAIEGTTSLFQCGLEHAHLGCVIQEVMVQAEEELKKYLNAQKLVDLKGNISLSVISNRA